MIKIGKRVLLANFPQLQVPKGEEAEIDIDVYGWKLKINVEFQDVGTEQAIQIQSTGNDGVRLIFQNWSNPIGSSLRSPARLALLQQGGALDFLATNYRIVDTNLFSLQFLHDKEGK
jgi:hypothetical protein